MDVCKIMRANVPTINEKATVREAVTLLHDSALSGLPVVDDNDELVGMVTEHDVIKALMPGYQELMSDESTRPDFNFLLETRAKEVRERAVSDIMIRNVIALSVDDTVIKAASTMLVKRIKVLPVVDKGKPIGIVSRIDLAYALIC